jgi:hypothetical protein
VAIRTFPNMLGEMSRRAHFDPAEARVAGTVYRADTAGRPGLIGVPPADHPTRPTTIHMECQNEHCSFGPPEGAGRDYFSSTAVEIAVDQAHAAKGGVPRERHRRAVDILLGDLA